MRFMVRVPYNMAMQWIEVPEELYENWPEMLANVYAGALEWDYERTKEIVSQYRRIEG